MSMVQDRTYLPPRAEGSEPEQLNEEFAELRSHLAKAALTSDVDRPMLVSGGDQIELPLHYIQILQQVAAAMSQGLAVSVVPRDMVLSTQAAAEMLGISRPTLVRLLEAGVIPFVRANRHRRVYLQDVLQYQERQRRAAHEALSDMVADAQMLGDYDDDPEEIREIAKQVRKGD